MGEKSEIKRERPQEKWRQGNQMMGRKRGNTKSGKYCRLYGSAMTSERENKKERERAERIRDRG